VAVALALLVIPAAVRVAFPVALVLPAVAAVLPVDFPVAVPPAVLPVDSPVAVPPAETSQLALADPDRVAVQVVAAVSAVWLWWVKAN